MNSWDIFVIVFLLLVTHSYSQQTILGQYEFIFTSPNNLQIKNTETQQILWETYSYQGAWISLYQSSLNRDPITKGEFNVKLKQVPCKVLSQTLQLVEQSSTELFYKGNLEIASSSSLMEQAQIQEYSLLFLLVEQGTQLKFEIAISSELEQSPYNTFSFSYRTTQQEEIYGLGIQYTYWNLKPLKVYILTSEQGIGRGLQPLTSTFNTFAKAGGNTLTTYASQPIYISSQNRAFIAFNQVLQYFDLSASSSHIEYFTYSLSASGVLLDAEGPLELIEKVTLQTGRMTPHPAWTLKGAILGIEGGMPFVKGTTDQMLALGVPITALWIQDWSGMNISPFAKTVRWNWQLDENWYPGWKEQFKSWGDIKALVYINPFLQKLSDSEAAKVKNNYYKIAEQNGYLLKNTQGEVIVTDNGIKVFATLDFTNPAAVDFYKNIIKQNVLEGAASSGYMCDFGEYIPFDALMFDGQSGAQYHNFYPQKWSQISREAVQESGLDDEVLFFSRSAWNQSPKYVKSFWLGDQLESWDSYDGLASVLYGHFSSGVIGHSLVHSDVGGYTVVSIPGLFQYVRTKQLLQRWIEFCAFSDSVFRTHPGSNPDENWQVWSDEDTILFFKKFAEIHIKLGPYKQQLMQLAYEKGYPMTRHMYLNYPKADISKSINTQFMLGTDVLMAPIVTEDADEIDVYLPPDELWENIWSRQQYLVEEEWRSMKIQAPIGRPAVFCRVDSQACKDLTQ